MVEVSHGPTDAEKHLQPAVGSRLSPIRHTPLLLGKTTDGRHLFFARDNSHTRPRPSIFDIAILDIDSFYMSKFHV